MDEFSFPVVETTSSDSLCHLPFTHSAVSPLWFLHRDTQTVLDESKEGHEESKESPPLTDEERMDMLWENFNEELSQEAKAKVGQKGEGGSDSDQHDTVELCCIRALGSLHHHGRPSLEMLLKVFKKLFLIHKSTTSSRRVVSIYRI